MFNAVLMAALATGTQAPDFFFKNRRSCKNESVACTTEVVKGGETKGAVKGGQAAQAPATKGQAGQAPATKGQAGQAPAAGSKGQAGQAPAAKGAQAAAPATKGQGAQAPAGKGSK